MDKERIKQIHKNMEGKGTHELLEIWVENDRKRYFDETFMIVKQVLIERGERILPQGDAGRELLRNRPVDKGTSNAKTKYSNPRVIVDKNKKFPAIVVCPYCKTELELEKEEQESGNSLALFY